MFARVAQSKGIVLGFVFILCIGLCAFAPPALAQIGNASLGGTVMDPSGGVIADAELALTSQATGFESKATSNERGEYTFRNLTPGTYDLKVTKTGFQSYVQKDIVLTINQYGRADATLKVGAAAETVTVEGERSEEHTSELQSPCNLVCRLLLEKKKKNKILIPHRIKEKQNKKRA